MKMVIDISISYNSGNFLSDWAPVASQEAKEQLPHDGRVGWNM
jgi:hypothetical protein